MSTTPKFLTDPKATVMPLVPGSPQFLTDPKAIRQWLSTYCNITGDIEISPEGRVSVDGDVQFNVEAGNALKRLAVAFDTVNGNFSCSLCLRLETLAGCPQRVSGNFSCKACFNLMDLVGSPTSIGRSFYCSDCHHLETLIGAPTQVGDHFDCSGCQNLLRLSGSPLTVGGNFSCDTCRSLSSLDGVSPYIGGDLFARDCPFLTRLSGLNTLKGYVCFNEGITPEAAVVANLLRQRARLIAKQHAKWISIVNDYHHSGDLLVAIAAFEKYFKVPFAQVDPTPMPAPIEIPTL